MKLKYSDVLELIIFVFLLVLFTRFLNNHYKCVIEYELIDYNTTDFNFSNYSSVYYDKTETLFVLQKNNNLPYDVNLSCNFRFDLKEHK